MSPDCFFPFVLGREKWFPTQGGKSGPLPNMKGKKWFGCTRLYYTDQYLYAVAYVRTPVTELIKEYIGYNSLYSFRVINTTVEKCKAR